MTRVDEKLGPLDDDNDHGELVRWLVKEGERVKPGQPICEVDAYGATLTVRAQQPGSVRKLAATVGQIVRTGSTLYQIET